MMFVQYIGLSNFLSFNIASARVVLRPLNIIIGPNGSGKSNFLDAFEVLRNAPTDILKPIRENGGFLNWLNKTEGGQNFAGMSIHYSLARDIYDSEGILHSFTLRWENVLNEPLVHMETVDGNMVQTFENLHPNVSPSSRKKSILAQLRDPVQYPEITYLAEVLPQITLYREWNFGRMSKPRLPQSVDLPNDFLLPDAGNLGLVLNRIRREPAFKKRLLEALRKLYDGIDDYDVQIEGGTVQVFFQESGRIIPATRLSDGTLRYLCLLAILLHPSPPPLICLEEPELGLHPDILPTIAELLKDAATRTQLIVTTHSDILVDAFTDTPEAVLVCEKTAIGSTLRRLSAEELKPWLAKYRLGELWTRGDIGGVRW